MVGGSEVQKVRQPGNLVARKFEESVSGTKLWDPSPAILKIKQLGNSVKEMILVFLQNGHIFYPFVPNIPKKQ